MCDIVWYEPWIGFANSCQIWQQGITHLPATVYEKRRLRFFPSYSKVKSLKSCMKSQIILSEIGLSQMRQGLTCYDLNGQ